MKGSIGRGFIGRAGGLVWLEIGIIGKNGWWPWQAKHAALTLPIPKNIYRVREGGGTEL